MTTEQRGANDDQSRSIILTPLAQVEPGSGLIVARSVGEVEQLSGVPQGFSLHSSFAGSEIQLVGDMPVALTDPSGRLMLLKNRLLDEVDASLNQRLAAKVARIPRTSGQGLSVLEIGGGFESSAAVQLAARNPDVSVTNVDIFLKDTVAVDPKVAPRVTPILADAKDLPLPDSSQDLVYSSRVLAYFTAGDFLKSLEEIVRVLKPGGEAIYYDVQKYIYMDDGIRRQLEKKIGAGISVLESFAAPGLAITLTKSSADPVLT